MLEFEKGSIEDVLVQLQYIGLELVEYEKTNNTIPIEKYKELLDFSICIARQTNEVSNKIDEMIEDITKKFN